MLQVKALVLELEAFELKMVFLLCSVLLKLEALLFKLEAIIALLLLKCKPLLTALLK